MALNNFSDVQAFFDDFIAANGISIATARHGAFWRQPGNAEGKFVNGNVPVVFNGSIKILEKGNSANSNIIRALKGEPPFATLRMPLGGPYFSDVQIQELADWIDGLAPSSPPLPELFASAPPPQNCRLLAFDEVQIDAGTMPNSFFLTVQGTAPCSNLDIKLIPYVYVVQPEYWQIEVVGCVQGGISLPVTQPFAVTIPLDNVTGTKGIEVIGATSTVRKDFPPN